MAQGSKVRIIDASTAHRVAPGWTYGFAEIVGRDAVAGRRAWPTRLLSHRLSSR
jgi:N-acetyl-gamma-glutamyl-phosphate reductase